jgi:hypothetical protein
MYLNIKTQLSRTFHYLRKEHYQVLSFGKCSLLENIFIYSGKVVSYSTSDGRQCIILDKDTL